MRGCAPHTGVCSCLLRAGYRRFPTGRRDLGPPSHPWARGLPRRWPQGCRLRTLPSISSPPFSLLSKKTCLEPRKETHSGGGLGMWARQSSDLHQDLGVTSLSLSWGRVPALDTSTQRAPFLRWLREKGPFPERDAHAGCSTTSRHRSVTQPKDKSNRHHCSGALGPSGKAFPSCSLALAASPARLPCVLWRMLTGGPSRSRTHVGWGPYPISIFDPTVCVSCSTSSSDQWL